MYIFSGNKLKINNAFLLFVYSLIWFYQPDKTEVYLWQTGSLNYFWTSMLFLSWFIPFYHYAICNKDTSLNNNIMFALLYFIVSCIVGLSHEAQNGAMLFAVIVCIVIQKLYYNKKIQIWQFLGFFGLLIGTIVVLCSLGNAIRAKDLGLWGNNIFIDKIFTFARLMLFSFALKPIYILTIITAFYIFLKKKSIKNIFNKKIAPSLFFVIFYLGSIFEYMLVSGKGYHARCLTLTSFICIIYLLFVIHNCLFDKNKRFFIFISIILSLQAIFSIIHTAYRMTGLVLFR